MVVSRLELRRPRREEAHPPKERFEERVYESGEIAERQQQGEDELVERGRERFAEVAEDLIHRRRRERRDERPETEREHDRVGGREAGGAGLSGRERELLGRARDGQRDGRRGHEDERERYERRAVDGDRRDRGAVPRVAPAHRTARERYDAPQIDLREDDERDDPPAPGHHIERMRRQHHREQQRRAKRRRHDRGAASLGPRLPKRRDEDERPADDRERRRRQREWLEPTAHMHEREKTCECDRLHHRARGEERREGARARPPHFAPFE